MRQLYQTIKSYDYETYEEFLHHKEHMESKGWWLVKDDMFNTSSFNHGKYAVDSMGKYTYTASYIKSKYL